MKKHVVIVIEGGGAKMPLETAQIEHIEESLNMPITEIGDLFVTTSAGSVEMSILITQRIRCKELNRILLGDRGKSNRRTDAFIKEMFTPRCAICVPRYDRNTFVHKYKQVIGDPIYMRESLKPFIMTSVNECDGRTHFFKSWEQKDGSIEMVEAACRSFAAMWYFGEMVDRRNKAIWTDGGVGIFNLPLTKAYVQARANGWLNEGHHTHILAICSGYSKYTIGFDAYNDRRTRLGRALKGLKFFLNPGEGGGARAMCSMEQIREMGFNAKSYTGTNGQGLLTFQYTQWHNMPEDLDKMDNWGDRWRYYDKGMELAKTIDLEALKK